mgnify:CR=1 FL=1
MNYRKLHEAELTSIIRERVDSQEWWVFLPTDVTGARKLQHIEREFYWDEAGHDFDVAALPQFGFSVALGKKSRAPRERLIAFMADSTETSGYLSEIGKRDIIILSEAGHENSSRAMFAMAMLTRLYDRHFPEMN